MNNEIFGKPLQRDPSIALPDLNILPRNTPGPVRKQQLVIELVGPRTVPAPLIQALLQPQWQGALGSPEIYVMAGADQYWRSLIQGDGSGAYDSVALAWDLLSDKGTM